MVAESGPVVGDEQPWAELVDVANVPVAELIQAHGDSPVLRSIERLQQALHDPNGILSAFSCYLPPVP